MAENPAYLPGIMVVVNAYIFQFALTNRALSMLCHDQPIHFRLTHSISSFQIPSTLLLRRFLAVSFPTIETGLAP